MNRPLSRFANQALSRRHFAAGLALAVLGPRTTTGRAAPIEPRGDDEPTTDFGRYFAQTGHNLKNPFYDRWRFAGGEQTLGLPLSEERYEPDVGVVQTFEGATLVFDPALEAPWDIQAQHLPDDVVRALAPSSARKRVGGCDSSSVFCQFFPERGHTLSGRIASFWQLNGDLPIFGEPLSEPFQDDESGAAVQLFERAVLEDHGKDDVRVRPMGRLLAEASGQLGAPAFLPAPPTGGNTKLVRADGGLRLRSGPSTDAEIIAVLADNAEFITAPGNSDDWIPGYADGYAGWVSADFLKSPPPLPTLSAADWNPRIWQGAALGESNVRSRPTTEADIVEVLEYGDPVTVSAWVDGEEVYEGASLWARIGSDRYVYARNIGRNSPVLAPSLPDDAPYEGRWIDVNLIQQLMVGYDGREPVRIAVTTTGMAGWETPPGFYFINSRVANETMTSGAIGAEHHYKLDDVLFTQYFTDRGHAIHFAWWRTPETIGRPGSHGCLNLLLDDSRFFWDWADIGVPVYVHP